MSMGLEGQGKGQQGCGLSGSALAVGSRQIQKKGEHLKGSAVPRAGLLGHPGLKVTQRAVSEAVFYTIGMTEEEMCPEEENSHLKRGLVCKECHQEVCVEAQGAHSIGNHL